MHRTPHTPAMLIAMALGPVLALPTPFAIIFLAFEELGNLLHGQPQGVNVGEEALMAVVLLPVAWIIAIPLARLWLRRPWWGYWGALVNGAALGLGWAALGTALAHSMRAARIGAAAGSLGLGEILTNAAFVGIPLGMAHAAVFWIVQERRAGHGRRWQWFALRIGAFLVLAWLQFGIIAALGALLD